MSGEREQFSNGSDAPFLWEGQSLSIPDLSLLIIKPLAQQSTGWCIIKAIMLPSQISSLQHGIFAGVGCHYLIPPILSFSIAFQQALLMFHSPFLVSLAATWDANRSQTSVNSAASRMVCGSEIIRSHKREESVLSICQTRRNQTTSLLWGQVFFVGLNIDASIKKEIIMFNRGKRRYFQSWNFIIISAGWTVE